ncbi:MAG: MFS transporter [Chlamydiae bacterium]|nr:Multidrug resistance protein MdtG [Chlamydiales bacterium]MCH9703996.1 MFS transporter [Chlamydiota bacterium]
MVNRILPVYFVVFLGYIGYSLFLTIFAPALLHHNYIDADQSTRILILGILIFMYPFGQFLSSPVLGALSDRFGRKPLMMYSLLVTTLVYVFIGFCLIYKWIVLLIISLFVAGLSEGNITIAQSAVADVSNRESRHRMFGYIYFASSCSYVIGPILGGWLSTMNFGNGPSYHLPFFIVAAMLLSSFFWILIAFKETAIKQPHVSYLEGLTNIKNLFTMKKLRFWFGVNFVLYLAAFGFLQGFPIYIVANYGVAVSKLSLMIAWTDIPFLVVNLCLIGYLAKRFHSIKILMLMATLLGIAMLLMILPNHEDFLWPLLLIGGFSVAVILPISSALISLKSSDEEQGRTLGINQSLNFFTEAISGLIVGLLAAAYVKLAIAVLGIMGFVALAMLAIKRK